MASDQRKVWTAIADAFAATRQRPWPHVVAFLESLPPGSRVLDLMAGNGRHSAAAAALGLDPVALDWSRPLLAKAPGARVLADAVALPLRDRSVDACVYAAGLHGLPGAAQRSASLRELRRVLRPGAPAQVTVWSRDAPRFGALGRPGEPVDAEVPWRAGGHDERRTYHLHTAASLRASLEEAGLAVAALAPVSVAEPADNLVALVHKN